MPDMKGQRDCRPGQDVSTIEQLREYVGIHGVNSEVCREAWIGKVKVSILAP
jgi:hypothetical protein